MAETRYRAWTRTLSAITGQPVMTGGAWVPGSPAAEVVVWTLRTPLGTFLPDPARGVDYAVIRRAEPGAPARLSAAITAALAYAVTDGTIADLRVSSRAREGYIQADVNFVDPRDLDRRSQRRSVRV